MISNTEPKRRNTSYEVFMSFVTLREEKVEARKIFSKECLDKWLKTRKNKVKHPQDSFQRVLYAHIRGVDERKPFPERVEAELLRLLRTEKPWRHLLYVLKRSPYRRRFNQLGYHEKKKQEAIKLKQKQEQITTSQQVIRMKEATTSSTSPDLLVVKVSYHDQFLAALEAAYPPSVRKSIIQTAKACGYDFHASALKYLCSLKPHPADLRFNPQFLIPSEPFEFSKSEPIGVTVMSSDWLIEYVNPVVEALLCGVNVIGKHSFDLTTGILPEIFSNVHKLPIAFKKGEVCHRCLILMPSGKYEVLHGKSIFVKQADSSLKYLYQFQVATHHYLNLSLHPTIQIQ